MRIRKIPSFSDETIKGLFSNNKVIEIMYLNRTDELAHLKHVNHITKSSFLRGVTKEMYFKYKNFPECVITITDDNIIRRNKGNNQLVVSTRLFKEFNIDHIKQSCLDLDCDYDLTILPTDY